mmetsp:Transcript_24751/g.42123  ORF Transcript_24751/g.42123 Transcript_24751/m.42123 type:complete len:81 (+) Transcript_24751:461-703(+)
MSGDWPVHDTADRLQYSKRQGGRTTQQEKFQPTYDLALTVGVSRMPHIPSVKTWHRNVMRVLKGSNCCQQAQKLFKTYNE